MAIIERPSDAVEVVDETTPSVATPESSYGVFRRPVETTGWKSWLFTIDHKKLGIMYGVVAMFFFVVGGIEAMLIRLQLAGPNGTVLSADKYNQMFTMHATTMVFLFVMPMAAAFANYFVPLQIGARDVAFPASMRSDSGRSSLVDCSSTPHGSWAAVPTVDGLCTHQTHR